MTVNFKQRLVATRPYQRSSSELNTPSESLEGWQRAFESDRGRIVTSAAVRRLQQKTQVFPLERNAAVRSRLTHSLEVQQTGRFISRTLFKKLGTDAAKYGLDDCERVVESLVEMACLMHDIGNPPFGHFGEAAISKWFASHAPAFPGFQHSHSERDGLLRELAQFEGNAQGIRLVTSLQRLNLTFAQTACILKYTRVATEERPAASSPLAYLGKKPGFYESERPYIEALQKALQLAPGHRFALAYLMEAADDISYCLADIEDGVDKGILGIEQLKQYLDDAFVQCMPDGANDRHFAGRTFSQVTDYALERAKKEPINKEHEFFVWLRVALIHPLVDHAAETFVNHIEAIFAGNFNRALLEDGSPCHAVIRTLKQVARHHIFAVSEVQTLELQGYRILTGLLDIYAPLLHMEGDAFKAMLANDDASHLLESRLAQRLPNKHVAAYWKLLQRGHSDQQMWEQYARCRLIQDMVSGMTDQFALDEFNVLNARSF